MNIRGKALAKTLAEALEVRTTSAVADSMPHDLDHSLNSLKGVI